MGGLKTFYEFEGIELMETTGGKDTLWSFEEIKKHQIYIRWCGHRFNKANTKIQIDSSQLFFGSLGWLEASEDFPKDIDREKTRIRHFKTIQKWCNGKVLENYGLTDEFWNKLMKVI